MMLSTLLSNSTKRYITRTNGCSSTCGLWAHRLQLRRWRCHCPDTSVYTTSLSVVSVVLKSVIRFNTGKRIIWYTNRCRRSERWQCFHNRLHPHSIVKTQVTQSNSKSFWTIFLQISEMIDMVKLTILPGLLSLSEMHHLSSPSFDA